MTPSGPELLDATARLVDIPSVSRDEGAIADFVEDRLRSSSHLDVVRIEHNVVARTVLGRAERVILAGHLDTVPAAGNARAVVAGTRCSGVGSTDMKGGLAVMLALAERAAAAERDLTFVFYAAEEVARSESGLLVLDRQRADLLAGDVAILLEPTNAVIEAGCQGVLRFAVTVAGRRAHSARPWVGRNAIHRLGALLVHVGAFPERQPKIDGVVFHESLQAVAVEGGVAGNVIPDRARLLLSHRFAPDRDVDAATAAVTEYLAPCLDAQEGDTLEILESAPSAPPSLDHPVLAQLVGLSGAAPVAKTAWTDVAFFASRGTPAANFGPGDPLLAHTDGEFVEQENLERVARALTALLGTE